MNPNLAANFARFLATVTPSANDVYVANTLQIASEHIPLIAITIHINPETNALYTWANDSQEELAEKENQSDYLQTILPKDFYTLIPDTENTF